MMNWVYEALKHINSRMTYVRRGCWLEVKDNVAKLPACCVGLYGMRISGELPERSASNLRMYGEDYPLASFPLSGTEPLLNNLDAQPYRHSIENGCIRFVAYKEGYVYIEYKHLSIDAKGYPMIPESHQAAVSRYIIFMIETREFYTHPGEGQKLSFAERQWLQHCDAARVEAEWPDSVEMRTLVATWNNMLPMPDPDSYN
jgi:hypothetical protein